MKWTCKKAFFTLMCVIGLFLTHTDGNAQLNLSLQEALDLGVKNNLTVSNARLDVLISKARIKETTAAGLPAMSGQLNFQSFLQIPVQVIPANSFNPLASEDEVIEMQFGIDNNATAGVNLTQLLFSGPYLVGLQASKQYLEGSRLSLIKTENEILRQIEMQYAGILLSEESKNLVKENTQEINAICEKARAINKAGLMEKTELDQLELTLNSMNMMLYASELQVSAYRQGLAVLLNMNPTDSLVLTSSIEDLKEVHILPDVGSMQVDTSNHLEVKIMDNNVRMLELNVKKEKSELLPTLSAFFNHNTNAYSTDYDFQKWYPGTVWGLNMQIPILDAIGQVTVINHAKMDLDKVKNGRSQLKKGLWMQFDLSKSGYILALKRLQLEEKNMGYALSILKNKRLMHANGSAGSFELSQANSQYINARSAYQQAFLDLIEKRIELKKYVK